MRKASKAPAYAALAAALGTILLLLACIFPSGKLVLICLASLGVVFVECRFAWKWALGAFAVTSLLSLLLLPSKAVAIYYAAFFGYYPLFRMWTERIGNKFFRYGLRLLLFNVCMLVLYRAASTFLSLDVGKLAGYPALLLLLINAAFLIYDRALAQGTLYFMRTIARRIK